MPGQHVGHDREQVALVQRPDPGNAQFGFCLSSSLASTENQPCLSSYHG